MSTKIEFVEQEIGIGNEHYRARKRTVSEIGFCKESPQEALRNLFFNFFIGDYALEEPRLEANYYLNRPDWKWVELIKHSDNKDRAESCIMQDNKHLFVNFLSIQEQTPPFGTETRASLEDLIRDRKELMAKAKINPDQEYYFYCDSGIRLIKFPGECIRPTRENLIRMTMVKMMSKCPDLKNEPQMLYGKTSDKTHCSILAKRMLAYQPSREVVEALLSKRDVSPEEVAPYLLRKIRLK